MSQRDATKPEQGYYIREDSLSWRTSRPGRKKMFRIIEKNWEKAIWKKENKDDKGGKWPQEEENFCGLWSFKT